ncbi:MAG: hypothetical protein A3F31_04605 [Candidatus Levybacteria bacterium RIFCSPHIGHO2_12_FULL_38_12]|nr:MAG: hypothetical protein A3D75_01300 [Candidatus Levybacteria bacterium RIFCSPHIGHO2_02_FULL_37_18]OGH22534.1 MAG: hypothetical protein A3F31_04605 [Candidatus Levybacteria bacterium RIFCSPHIGHO2_12_FULL_38_12]OGH33430.1 MAG: hypothetical protein A3A47_04250 [Candidatus Levybacteria bacterium RIFCSPLOWO2_01_FULL_37_20]OGH44071.1 MAG: hypothetical protein A3J14_04975 [Candidatus Levybacteria bacterium RIFCSPLOWO2_02_FULL_37_18]OGH50440.1 MAG: hypothetical protein A3G13_01380 [Candidatus Levy
MNKKIAGIILAAGKGKRMNVTNINKVTLSVFGKPMIVQNVEHLKQIGISPIVIVVGFAKQTVMSLFSNEVMFAEQKDLLGTAVAVSCGIDILPANSEYVLIINGDTLYSSILLEKVINTYFGKDPSLLFATIHLDNPTGIGRIVRKNGNVSSIIEEKDATEAIRLIKEVNAGCYIGKVSFFKKYLPLIVKSSFSGEYYLTDIIDVANKNHEIIETIEWGEIPWTAVNSPQDLKRVQHLKNREQFGVD